MGASEIQCRGLIIRIRWDVVYSSFREGFLRNDCADCSGFFARIDLMHPTPTKARKGLGV